MAPLPWSARSRVCHETHARKSPRGRLGYAWPLRRFAGDKLDADKCAVTLALAYQDYEPWRAIFGDEHVADGEWVLRKHVQLAGARNATAYVVDARRDGQVLAHAAVGVVQRQRRSSRFTWAEKAANGFLGAPLLGAAAVGRLVGHEAAVDEIHEADVAAHGVGDHVYLAALGVHPGARRHGLGSDVVRAVLDDADAAAAPVFTVCDRSLARFLRKFGFAPSSTRDVGDGVVLVGMLRHAHVADVLNRWGSKRHHRPRRPPDPRYRAAPREARGEPMVH